MAKDSNPGTGFGLATAIEEIVAELATARRPPVLAIGLCLLRYPEAGRLLRSCLNRAADGQIANEDDATLLWRGLYVMGGRRDPLAFKPLLRLLYLPDEELERLLGDVVTEGLARIAAGVFDGDADALFAAILDLQLDQYVRDALLGAATFLTWKGRIDRARMARFLELFFAERSAPKDEEIVWHGWQQSVALLGLRSLAPAFECVWAEGRITEDFMAREDFAADLARAEQAPDDAGRFTDAHLGYIDDVLAAMEFFDGDAKREAETAGVHSGLAIDDSPAINPWRDVGRNDPCPCGSGKKAKRCCLAA